MDAEAPRTHPSAPAERPARATRAFEEREEAFVALSEEALRQEMTYAAQDRPQRALADLGPDATFRFTGREFTGAQLETQSAARPRSTAGTSSATTTRRMPCSRSRS